MVEEKSIEKSNENVMDSSIEKNQSDEIKRQKIEKTQFEEGEYSMSFESITDLKNQEFPKDETISNFESRKEMETFDDTISSISIDDRPSESFLKQDQLDLLESAFVNNEWQTASTAIWSEKLKSNEINFETLFIDTLVNNLYDAQHHLIKNLGSFWLKRVI